MCRSNVAEDAREPLAALLADMAEALDPGHGEQVIVGPVDFGPEHFTSFAPLTRVNEINHPKEDA